MTYRLLTPQLDSTVRPQDDFFGYVNSKWLKENPLPDSESRWGIFYVLRERSWEQMRDIFENLQDDKSSDVLTQQARDFYYSGMQFDALSDNHWDTLASYMEKIEQATTTDKLSFVIGELHRIGVNVPWAMIIDTDDSDATRYLVRLYQSGLSLPNRDYYLSDDKEMVTIRSKYKQFLEKVHTVSNKEKADKSTFVDTIFAFETRLAEVQRSPEELRNIEGNYNPISFKDLQKTYPNINWQQYAKGANWSYTEHISHDQPEFMSFINAQFAEFSFEQWHIYLKWQLLRKFLPFVSAQTAELYFEFYGKVISGTKEDLPLWKKVVMNIDRVMGENVGQLYVKHHFPEESKKKVLALVDEVTDTFATRIERLDWMSQKTKKYAVKKLRNMKVLIGYPDSWRDFSVLKITNDSFIDNIIRAEIFNHDFEVSRLDQPNTRDEWHMSPQTVNAYHDPNRLVICFPAGILQSPFFDPTASDAQNFSGIGVVIGHELTHAFDDQGCQFDADGNVREWQTLLERRRFTKKAQLIKDQADAFEVLPGLKLKGDLVIGESIADLGGVELALEAWVTRRGQKPTKEELQEFFVNYAFTEAGVTREQRAREFALTDPHPPSVFRVNAIVQHVDHFYEAFSLIPYDKLFRLKKERAKIW